MTTAAEYALHREARLTYGRHYYLAHREERLAYQRHYNQKYREEIRSRRRSRRPPPDEPVVLQCVVCGIQFCRGARGPLPLYCSRRHQHRMWERAAKRQKLRQQETTRR